MFANTRMPLWIAISMAACSGPGNMTTLQSPELDTPDAAAVSDSEVTDAGRALDAYLAAFDVAIRWLPTAAHATLVNWQTGLAAGNVSAADNCAQQEGSSDTYCSSFVSAVTYWGTMAGNDLFTTGAIDFLRPFNGAQANLPLPAGIAYPQNGCAWRDYLSNYQHDWLAGTLLPGQAVPYAADSNDTWDYWNRDPDAPGAPRSAADAGWVAVLDGTKLRTQDNTVADVDGGIDGLVVGQQAMVVAQRIANRGHLVIATFRAPVPAQPGHLTVLRVSDKSLASLQSDGPQVITAGAVNAASTSVREAFDVHSCDNGAHPAACGTTGIGAWESMGGDSPQISFFFHLLPL